MNLVFYGFWSFWEDFHFYIGISVHKQYSDLDKKYLDQIIELNFDNDNEVKTFLNKVSNNEKSVAFFSSKWMLKT